MTTNKITGFDRTEVLAPLVIGVTGHRDLREENVPQLEQKIKEIFLQLHQDYPATPLVLISALAEGADRLAAEVALSPHLGVRLIVPLPMPVDLYEQDFDRVSVLETPLGAVVVEDSTREEFRALIGRAANCFVLDLAKGNTLESISRQGPERDRQYELVGRYIAQQSQILIALWDGVDSDRVGGTASVVRFQREGVPATDPCALETQEGFPVYQILTPRQKNPFPQGEILQVNRLYPKIFRGIRSRRKTTTEKCLRGWMNSIAMSRRPTRSWQATSQKVRNTSWMMCRKTSCLPGWARRSIVTHWRIL